MPKHIDVFISSTSKDFALYRAKVKEAVLRLGAYPIGMEEFDATPRNALQLCYDEVQQAAVFIGVYAHRYGFVPGADMTYRTADGTVRSGDGATGVTHWEYRWAQARGLPTLLYVVSEKDGEGKLLRWEPDYIDDEPNKARLQAFKRDIMGRHTVGFFYSPEHLQAQVTSALSKVLADLNSTPEADSGVWAAGVRFDHYTLRQPIGAGGNGEVWRADDHLPDDLTRDVAIKVLRAEISIAKLKRIARRGVEFLHADGIRPQAQHGFLDLRPVQRQVFGGGTDENVDVFRHKRSTCLQRTSFFKKSIRLRRKEREKA